MRNFLTGLFILLVINGRTATVDSVAIFSKAMNKSLNCVVIKPNSYKKKKNVFPTVYLLHGYGGWFSNWIIRVPQLKEYSDRYQLIIVCPEGANSSWYFDSPVDSTMRFETFVGKEVPEYIDQHYRTIQKRTARAITGLSMGGHGAFFLAFRHSDIFGACGSMSGVMNLYTSRNGLDISKRIGDTLQHADNWKNYSAFGFVQPPKDSLAIIFDCGVNDTYFADNKKLHEKMLSLKIPHDFSEKPGTHSWSYWANSIQYHLLFFRNYFDAMNR